MDTPSKQRVRLAVVGDVHGQWGPADAAALKALEADAVLWVGDIGNEDVGLMQQIAALEDLPKAIIGGNHDSWYTMTARGRWRAAQRQQSPAARSPSPTAAQQHSSSSQQQQPQQHPDNQQQQQQLVAAMADRVQQQLEVLGDNHVGYGHKALQGSNISIVGARPFSKGGKDFSSIAEFMSRFGVSDMQQSAAKIVDVVNSQVPAGAVLVLLAHNGPTGLGAERHAICGVDWLPEAGDHGDPDLRMCLDQLHAAGKSVALLLHGHMHHMIKGGGRRQMVAVDPTTSTLVLNAATVPRVVPLPHSNGAAAAAAPHRHHFLVVELQDGMPCCAADVWVQTAQHSSDAAPASSDGAAAAAQQRSFLASAASAMHAVQHSKSKNNTQKQSAAKATQDEALRRVQLQAPHQLQLSRQELLVDGFRVHVAEVHEVLRAVQPDAAAAAAAAAGNGGTAAVDGHAAAEGPHWQLFDAHLGKWVVSAATAGASAQQVSSCKAAST